MFSKKYDRLFSQYIMMKNPKPKKGKIIKNIRNLFRSKKEQNDAAIKAIRNLFRLKRKLKELKT